MTEHDNVIPFPGRRRGEPVDSGAPAEHVTGQPGSPVAMLAALPQWAGSAAGWGDAPVPRPVLFPRRRERVGYVLRVGLDHVRPPIWRRVRVASDIRLTRLHDILQVVMGWTDSHLHQFRMGTDAKEFGTQPFLTEYDLREGEDDGIVEGDVRLDEVFAEPGDQLFYEYDFGDSWHHTLRLEKVEAWHDEGDVLCLGGGRACPPEDVGGVGAYEEILAGLAGDLGDDPVWMREQIDWLPDGFDPAVFDVVEVNETLRASRLPDLSRWHPAVAELLRRAGGSPLSPVGTLIRRATAERIDLADADLDTLVSRYAHLIRVIGEGLTLTAAGYLPPRVVAAVQADLGLDPGWSGKGTREDQTWSVLSLRESATAMGLLRKQKGKLLVTRAGRALADDPRGLFGHIRGRLPLGHAHEKDAGVLDLLYAACGEDLWTQREDAAYAFAQLGWHSTDGDLARGLWQSAEPTQTVLEHLSQDRGRGPLATRIARALLAR